VTKLNDTGEDASFLMLVRVDDHRGESHGHEGFWPAPD
jgi:hypothetical protein